MAFENEAAKKILSQIDRDERVGIDYEIDVSKSFLGHEGKGVEPLVQSGRRDLRISLRRKDQAASAGSGEFVETQLTIGIGGSQFAADE